MPIINRIGGGSGSGYKTNFQVVNKSSQPTDPKENTIWLNTPNVLNCWTYGPELPLRRSKNKNFVTYPYANSTVTTSGITYTDNGDGTVTVNGTANGSAYFRVNRATAEEGMMLLPAGTYTMSGCPAGGSSDTYMIQLITMDAALAAAKTYQEYGDGLTFTLSEDTLCRMNFYVKSGAKVSNLTAYFQVEAGSAKTAFEKGNANGQVWLKSNTTGVVSFDALRHTKDGNIIAFCIDEVWLFRNGYDWKNFNENTKVYQNGAWTDFQTAFYIYNKGNSTGYSFACDTTMKQMSSGHDAEAARVTIGSTSITVKTTTRGYDFTNIFTTTKVDLSQYTKLRIKGTVSGATKDTACVFRALTEMGDLATQNNALSQSFTTGTIDATVDIGSVNSSCYLGFTFYNDNQGVTEFTLTELWLE